MFTVKKSADATAVERQNRRLKRLKDQGVSRYTVLAHEDCKPALEVFRHHLIDPGKAKILADMASQLQDKKGPTNVAQVKQLSPFRYPGGKTWLVPEIRKWVIASRTEKSIFVEPFAGGAMAGLTVAAENLTNKVYLSEIDADVSAVWNTIFNDSALDGQWLCKQILSFDVTLENVQKILKGSPKTDRQKAFRTIVKNRMQRGGIMAAGAGLVKAGESGRGLLSRWYPETLALRIKTLMLLKKCIRFDQVDAFDLIKKHSKKTDALFFIDPPYTAGGKKAGKRLYTHSELDHEKLFETMSNVKGRVMMTYDDADEVRALAKKYNFEIQKIPMKNTHHEIIYELLIMKL